MTPRHLGWPFRLWALAGTIASPALRLLLRRRLRAGKELRDRLAERRGLDTTPRPDGRLIWLHAASVGETLSLLPLLQALCRLDPALHLLLTTGTVTAQVLARERIDAAGLGPRITTRFVPLDVPLWIGRFLDHWRPDLAVLVESELWPGLVAGCAGRGIGLVLLNARLSARSARRWARAGFVARRLLGAFAWISARSAQDAARLRALGASNVAHDRDLKQAAETLPFDQAELRRLQALIGDRPVWLASSTHEGEEPCVAAAHAALSARFPGLLTILAPRHPQRGDAVARSLPQARRRSLGQDPSAEAGIWLCDTLGELGLLYRLSDIVLLGNSLAEGRGPGGGHNPLEPARLGCALAAGPRMQNFDEDTARLTAAGGLVSLSGAAAIQGWVGRMLDDPQARRRMAEAARSAAAADPDLPDRLARRLLELLPSPLNGPRR